jgi:AcrR family transcriptional regulator
MTAATVHVTDECSRRGRPRDERLDSGIAAAAVDVLAEVGFDRFSVEEVALRAGVAKSTVYRRFPTRSDLIAGALAYLGDETALPVLQGSVRERLTALLSAIRDSTPASARGRILMHAMASRDTALAQLVHDRVLSPRAGQLRSIVEEGIASGELRRDLDVDACLPVLVGPMLYLGMWRMRESVSRLTAEQVVNLVMVGLTPANDS